MATTIDEYHGQGGSYELDSKTGKRKLIERTQPAPQPSDLIPEVLSNAAPESQAPNSGEN